MGKLLLCATFLSVHLVLAALPDGRLHGNMMPPAGIPVVSIDGPDIPVTSRNGTVLPPYNTTYLFDQLIDHNNPSLGTFKQRFWHTYEFYESGGPIILMTPGEVNADGFSGYLTNKTVNGLIAQQQNGSTIVLEHRFYGLSNPKPDLSVESLRLHTIQQAIDDLEYFAQHVNLPMPNGDQVTPGQAPWILIGGSYSGALTSWTMVNKPDVFFAGYASSGVVEAILDFWEYFEPIREHMPQNCSSDVETVISHIDTVFQGKDAKAIQTIKDNFGMGEMTHLDDVAGSLRNNLWDWQSLQPTSGPGTQFTEFCDALEVKDNKNAPAAGWGLDHALDAWGSYWRTTYLAVICGDDNVVDCLGTYNTSQSFWTDTSIDNSGRSWMWIVCNEVGFLQEGAPLNHPSLVTRLVQPNYDLRQCQQMFSAAFPTEPNVDIVGTNAKYKGWNVKLDRLFFANGMRDPWRDATISAESIFVPSTDSQPIAVGDGFHCSDLLSLNSADSTIAAVQQKGLAAMKTWLSSWKPGKESQPTVFAKSIAQPARQISPPTFIKPITAWVKSFGSV